LAESSRKALMLTVFGTSTEASVTFDELVPLARKEFPARDVVVPYTSATIRDKLNAKISIPAQKILSPGEMLERLKSKGYADIAVVTTLLFAGVEHDKLKVTVDEFRAANPNIKVSYTPPLLVNAENLRLAVNSLSNYLLKDGANIVVAHGTQAGHPAEKVCLKLADMVSETFPNARLGSIMGVPKITEVLSWARTRPGKDVRFVVFMFVAGEHAENDIASGEEGSMFSAVRGMGKTPSLVWVKTREGQRMASLGLNSNYRSILLDYYLKHTPQ
jgi:sirohydrochlorin cobaltochelatase